MLSNAIARHHQATDMVRKDAATLADELDVEISVSIKGQSGKPSEIKGDHNFQPRILS